MKSRMLMRRLPNLTTLTPPSFSSYSSFNCRLFSSPSQSSAVSGAAATDVADVAGEEDLLYPASPSTSAVKPVMIPTLLQPRVVVYDGVCHLCHRGVKWVINADKDRKIKFCCLQSKAAEPYLRVSGLDREDLLRRFLFVEGPESYHQASTAALVWEGRRLLGSERARTAGAFYR